MTYAIIGAILWFIIMFLLWTNTRTYKNIWDRVTRAKYRDDGVSLQIMLDHLRSFPEEWSISRDAASFPKEGAKKIYLNHDKKSGWEYTLNSFGGARPLDGHYGAQFSKQLVLENGRRERQALLSSFYPDLNGPLLLK